MILDLAGTWSVRRAESADPVAEASASDQWCDATVPGCVHLDLMAAGEIPDPFYGFHENDVRWVQEADWLYRRAFDCSAELLDMRKVELVCKGLDTFAELYLNGRRLGRADNMFRQWRWDVSGLLKEQGNELLVLFESAERIGIERQRDDGTIKPAYYGRTRAYVRKAQYAAGWDWGPDLNTCGIWLPIHLEGFSKGRISDVCARVDWSDADRPVVKVTAELDLLQACSGKIAALLDGSGTTVKANADVDVGGEAGTVQLELPVENPQLWWPAGFGEQNLYSLTVEGELDGEALGPVSMNIGLRRVELVREKDEEGESFVFRINGEPIFCRGANWIPADSFIPRVTNADYEHLVRQAAEANMNMLRVWGGGIYELDGFYDACDRLGIMVWQDFAFACSGYPDHLEWFCDSVRAEAESNVRRLRNHASLVLWCGNNECQSNYPKAPGKKLYDEILPAVCAELDPTRPYWPGSPYGGENPKSDAEGDQHFWDSYHRFGGPEAQRRCTGRFLSEFGFQGPPAPQTIREYIPSSGHHMQSRLMEHHNKMRGGTDRNYYFLANQFRVPDNFDDTVYLMQLAQAEGVKIGVEHWRARKFRTAGTLFWQLNDCWPVTSWSCVDYRRRPKALYYYARRFFAPVLAAIDRRKGQFAVRVVNDRPTDFEGELICGFGHLNGDQDWVERFPLTVPANGIETALTRDEEELPLTDPATRYFWCRLMEGRQEIGRNAWFPAPCKHVPFETPEWEIQIDARSPRTFEITLSNNSFVKGAWLRMDGVEAEFSDNYFDVFPEVPVRLALTAAEDLDADGVRRRLRIRSVAEAQQG